MTEKADRSPAQEPPDLPEKVEQAAKPAPHRFTPEEASAAGRKGGRATKRPRGLAKRRRS